MTRTLLTRAAAFIAIVGIGLAVPAEAWAGILEQVEAVQPFYQEIAAVAGILTALWVVDTVTWPYLTGRH